MTGYAWLGPVGELRGVPCPQAGVPVGVERVGSEWLTLGGSRVVQRGRRVHRSWDFGFVWGRPADLAWFTELASGGVVGPYYLYTSKAAVENLAPTQLQSGGSGVVAGRRVLAVGDPQIGVSRQVPVLPGRAYHLSALGDGSGSVTVAADDPHALTNLATNPSFETAGGTVEVWRNLFPNPAFRTNTYGWAASATVEIGREPSEFSASGWAARVEYPAGNNLAFFTSVKLVASEGDIVPVSFSCWGGAPDDFGVEIRFWNAVGTLLRQDNTLFTLGAPGNPKRVAVRSNAAPAGTVDCDVVLRKRSTVEARHARFFDFSTLPTGEFADGSYSPDSDLTPSWTGAVNASASILTGTQVTGVTAGVATRVVQSSRGVMAGSKALRIIPTTASNDTFAAVGGDAGAMRLGMVAGKTYTVAVWCYLEKPLTGTLLIESRRLHLRKQSYVIVDRSPQAPNEAGMHLIRWTFTVPADATQAFIRASNGASAGGGDVWFDNFTIVEGSHPDLMPFGQASSASAVLTPPTGKRASATILSGDATHVTLTTTAGVGQLRLTEGTHTGFMTGDGVPPVEILDPQETLQRVIAGDHRSDFTITVKETG